jgi:hypothetical protein
VVVQWTNAAPPDVPVEMEDGLADVLDVAVGCTLGLGEVRLDEDEPPHAAIASAAAITTPLRRTG